MPADSDNPVWTYLTCHIIQDMYQSTMDEDAAGVVLEWQFRDRVRGVISTHYKIAKTIIEIIDEGWDKLGPKSKRLLASLVKSCLVHDATGTWHRKIIEFALLGYNREGDPGVKVGLAFAAFHAGGGADDEKLVSVIDWVEGNRKQFDELCRGFYARFRTPVEAEAHLRQRLATDELRHRFVPIQRP